MERTVLVTGGAGYIGSVLVRLLLQRQYRVRAVDVLRAGGESLVEVLGHPGFEFVHADIREPGAMRLALTGVWGVVHLAAIVGDPACAAEPDVARSTNEEGTMQLYELAEAARVQRFIFTSTCSNYGRMGSAESYVDESSRLAPLSLYAETKVAAEKFLLGAPRSHQARPTVLRFSTAYGLSPRIRFDLTVNEFTREVALGRELVVYGEQFWRPYCHVSDLARSAVCALEKESAVTSFEVFNVGDTDENYQKRMIVEAIAQQIPGARARYVTRAEDPRDYRVAFGKIAERLGFRITRRVPDGIREMAQLVQSGLLLNPDDARYSNVGGK